MTQATIDLDTDKKVFLVSFPYDESVVEYLRGAPERKWVDKYKVWVLPATHVSVAYLRAMPCEVRVVETAKRLMSVIEERERTLQDGLEAVDAKALQGGAYAGYEPKTRPFKHQVEGFELARRREGFGLFFEQGLGKTKVAIDLCCHWLQTGVIDKVLILCPSFVKGVWVREIEAHSPVRMPVYVCNGSDGKKRRAMFAQAHTRNNVWLVTNYEELLTAYVSDFRYEVQNWRYAVIADESTKIKNRAARITEEAIRLADMAHRKLILTGTPMANCPLDFWSQFKFVGADLGYKTFTAFRNQYAEFGGYGGHEVVKWKHLDELKERVKKFSLRRTKDECLDLPPKIYQTVKVELPKDLRKAYEDMRENCFLELSQEAADHGGRVSSMNVVSKLVRLSQIAGSTLKLEDGVVTRFKQTPKLDAVIDILEDIEHPTIIWAHFIAEIDLIAEELQKRGVACSKNYGDTKASLRQQNIDDFQTGKTKVFIGNAAACGLGITLTAAHYIIYYSNSYSATERWQAEDRTHRIGLDHSVTYIDIVADDTVDEHVLKALEKKQDLAKYLVDNGVNPLRKNR